MTEPRYDLLLLWALWKLQGSTPITITLDDVQACRQAFQPSGPVLLMRGPGDAVELCVTSAEDARMRREFDDSMTGTA